MQINSEQQSGKIFDSRAFKLDRIYTKEYNYCACSMYMYLINFRIINGHSDLVEFVYILLNI